MIKTILVDDHELIRSGIEALFAASADIDLIASFASLDEALPTLASCDILVVDAMLGETDAIVQLLGDSEPWITPDKIVVVTGQGDGQYIFGIDQMNVAGLVSKASDPSQLVDAVKSAAEKKAYRCPEIERILESNGDQDSPLLVALSELSQRERQIVDRSAAGQRPTDIAEDLGLSVKTINTYRYRAYQKLGCKNDVELARMFVEAGVISGSV